MYATGIHFWNCIFRVAYSSTNRQSRRGREGRQVKNVSVLTGNSMLSGVVCCSVLQCVAVCCSVLKCVAVVCCSVLQCVAVCRIEDVSI